MAKEIQTSQKLRTMPVGRLLLSMSAPMMISMLVQALYNVVDSVFVARIGTAVDGENALAALALAFPMQNLMISVAVGTGVGINALISRSLGAMDKNTASKTAGNGYTLSVLSSLLFLLVGAFLTRSFIGAQTDNPVILEYGVSYLQICTCLSIGLFLQVSGERMLQSTGHSVYSMIAQLVGAVANIVLDPILIYGLLGMPKMGVAGAAAATVVGQILAGAAAFIFNIRINKELRLSWRALIPKRAVIFQIYRIGLPSILMASIGSVMTFCMNNILLRFSETAITVFGVYFKLQSFIFMPVFGLNSGLVPIISYNYGARNPARIKKAIKLATVYAVCLMLLGILLMQLIPDLLLRLFNADERMLDIGCTALRIISIGYLFAGFCIIFISTFQALDASLYSTLVSVARQLLVLIPLAYLFSLSGNIDFVWMAFPIAELVSLTLCSFIMFTVIKRRLNIR